MRNTLRRACAVVAVALAVVLPGTAGRATATSAATSPPAYWLVAADGTVSPFGGAPFYGGANGTPLNKPIVGMTSTPDGHGYWLVATDGGIFSYGDAAFYGSTGGLRLNKPVVGMASTADGHGYWLVASDGGIFTFGDAPFYGSTGGLKLNKPVVGMAPTPDGRGYWLVATDGGIFTFGDAAFYGSTGGLRLNKPVVGMAPTPDGRGYWLVASDGGIFSFGDAQFYGSTGGLVLNKPIVQMASTPDGKGYWLVASDGGIFTFGDAPFAGSLGSTPQAAPVVTIAATFNFGSYPAGATGYDISWPQCPNAQYPTAPSNFAIVGINDGHAFSANPCLAGEWAWAVQGGRFGSVYVNTNFPDGTPGTPTDPYQFGYAAGQYSLNAAQAAGVTATIWWLDVETKNTWSADPIANSEVIQGELDALHAAGKTVGVYCTPYQWGIITGDLLTLNIPVWAAGAPPSDPASYCTPSKSVGGGPVWLVQYTIEPVDYDLSCGST